MLNCNLFKHTITRINIPTFIKAQCEIALVFILLLGSMQTFAKDEFAIPIEKTPSQIVDYRPKLDETIPHSDVKNGVFHLLVENQVKVPAQSKIINFYHYARKALDTKC